MRPHFRSLACLALVVLALQQGQAQVPAQQPLKFFKNYFVTGDYVVRGASLWRKGAQGWATANIPPLNLPGSPDNVPATADILAAFLYVQTAERSEGSGIDHAKFLDYDLGPYTLSGSPEPGSGTFFKRLVNPIDPAPCWPLAITGRKLVTYRADVLRFLPIDPVTKKQELNKPHKIVVPDMGPLFTDDDEGGRERADITGPRAIGASLVVVYRDTNKPFSAIVMYDGAFTKRALARMDQSFVGFYDAATSPMAKMTHIVGDGGPFRSEKVTVGTQQFFNPYTGSLGPRWDNPTFNLPTLPLQVGPYGESTSMTVDRFGLIPDCVSFSAAIISMRVQDADGDGLVDGLEDAVSPLLDPNGQPQPNLHAMGASSAHKDLFLQIDYMTTAGPLLYGGVSKRQHSHLPTPTALKMMGDAFKEAPFTNVDGTKGIHVHIDAGANYPVSDADEYIIRNGARGGHAIDETVTVCLPDASDPRVCQFSAYPGTVGWKTGLRILRDEELTPQLYNPDGSHVCDVPGNDGPGQPCERRFDRSRKDTFHYALFAHSIGLPKESCLNQDGGLRPDTLTCRLQNLDFRTPRTNSGIADFPGGDVIVSLGSFDDGQGVPVGTDYMQGATLLHELGHNLYLTHAGKPQVPRLPNCNPLYLSVMNYMYQLRGLLDNAGHGHMDLNRYAFNGFAEVGLNDGQLGLLSGALPYKIGWYAPKNTSYLRDVGTAATKHCDGSEIGSKDQPTATPEKDLLAQFGGLVRVDGVSVDIAKIDWNADGLKNSAGVPTIPSLLGTQDINFSGTTVPIDAAKNDWINIRLNEVGGRRNVAGLFKTKTIPSAEAVGPFSLDVGHGDIGHGDIGHGDIGHGDIGHGDIGHGDIGHGDIGHGDIGHGDIGHGDIGHGDIGRGLEGLGDLRSVFAANEPVAELSLEVARAVEGDAPSPPSGLSACLTSGFACATDGGSTPVLLNWEKPHAGRAIAYNIHRFTFAGEFVAPSPAVLQASYIDTVFGEGTAPTHYFDYTAPLGSQVAYVVRAIFDDESLSGISNFATVTTPTPTVINFEAFGPRADHFTVVELPLTVGIATFSGGQLLGGTVTNLPADPTIVYGTANFCEGCLSTITIDFSQRVSNVSLFLMNGKPFVVTYTVQDNLGGSQVLTLQPNSASGAQTVTLRDRGITQVQIHLTGTGTIWDFFIDNVQFVAVP